jgi:AhpD family alkylhydroperoxidase
LAVLKKYQMGESVIPQKYREFIGLAVAANIKCPYCLLMHTAMATGYGATGDEISEVALLAGQTASGAPVHQIGEFAKKKAEQK